MDIDLLAKMVKEAVMDHDCVTLPGVGSFVAELVPAAFADRGYTILPPYRRLYFVPRQADDRLLAALYARSNSISEADAQRILEDFLKEMKEVLMQKKTIVFPGLGRLRATRENHFFFVADEDLDIYPAGFGLQPISLKTHEETKDEVAEAVASLAQILEPAPDPVILSASEESPVEPTDRSFAIAQDDKGVAQDETPTEPAPVAPDPAPDPVILSASEESPVAALPKKSPWRVLGIVLLVLLGLALVAAVALAVVGRVAPDWIDSYLYSPAELEILRK